MRVSGRCRSQPQNGLAADIAEEVTIFAGHRKVPELAAQRKRREIWAQQYPMPSGWWRVPDAYGASV